MADKLLSTVLGFARALPIGTSLGGNGASDSGKALIFGADGSITASTGTSGAAYYAVLPSGATGSAFYVDLPNGSTATGITCITFNGSAGYFIAKGATGWPITCSSSTSVSLAKFQSTSNNCDLDIDNVTLALHWRLGSNHTLLIPNSSGGTLNLPAGSGTLALDAGLVHSSGAETITGDKKFQSFSENQTNATTTSGGTLCTLSITASTFQVLTLTASVACVVTMPPVGAGRSFTLMVKQPATTGNATASFTNVQWGAAGSPTITATAGRMDILSFTSDGVKWYGSYVQGYTY